MFRNLVLASIWLSVSTPAAFATTLLSAEASQIKKIEKGHGETGEVAVSKSNPGVSFEVLASGKVRRVNHKTGTSYLIDPKLEAHRSSRGR